MKWLKIFVTYFYDIWAFPIENFDYLLKIYLSDRNYVKSS